MSLCSSFTPQRPGLPKHSHRPSSTTLYETGALGDGSWNGDVVPEGTIKGCSVTPVGASGDDATTNTEWIITIDGVEADLGRFSEAIYKQIMSNAKQDRFQGFRPGTIPPHLLPTYKAFCMDEVARETVLESMQQNNIRPFTDARSQFVIEQVSIPPPATKKKKNKKRKSNKKKGKQGDTEVATAIETVDEEEPEPEPQWRRFDDMDGAIKAGWKPGQSFSFVAKNVKGQNVLPEKDLG
ncbi:MAG: hypothetical protein SGILL_003132, partial [Bacillariaceae sp.]